VEVGVNVNGDLPFNSIAAAARLIECSGFAHIWVGESPDFKHPLPVIAAIAHCTDEIKVCSGILSYLLNRPLHIRAAFETLSEEHGARFAIGLAPGDLNALRSMGIEVARPLERLEEAIEHLRGSELLRGTPIYVGASGPRMIELGSRLAEGVLLNYAYPEYVEWAVGHVKGRCRIGVYAPAHLAPDKKGEKAVLFASAHVLSGSNKTFQERFNLQGDVEEIRKAMRQGGYERLRERKDFLLGRFAFYGSVEELLERMRVLKKMGVELVILGSPFAHSLKAIELLARAL